MRGRRASSFNARISSHEPGVRLRSGPVRAGARRLEIQDAHFAEISERLLDELSLRPRDRVVEFGCGPGSFSRRILRRLGTGGVLVGVDSSEGLLAEASAALAGSGPARFEPVLADVSGLGPWLDGADAVTCRTMLHHIPMVEFVLGRLRAACARHSRRLHRARFPLAAGSPGPSGSNGPDRGGALRIWAIAINHLYEATRLSPDVGGTMAQTLELAGYRQVRGDWMEGRSDPFMVENMLMFYDEVRDALAVPRHHDRRSRSTSSSASSGRCRSMACRLRGEPSGWRARCRTYGGGGAVGIIPRCRRPPAVDGVPLFGTMTV